MRRCLLLGTIAAVGLALGAGFAAAVEVTSRPVTVLRHAVASAASALPRSRPATLQSRGVEPPPSAQSWSRWATLQSRGIEPSPSAHSLSRLATLQNRDVEPSPSAEPLARAFTVFKAGPSDDVAGPEPSSAPLAFILHPAHPNPMHRVASMAYELADRRLVRLDVYDANGRRVRSLVSAEDQGPGRYTVQWDGTAENGHALPAGIYWLRFTAGRFDQARRIVLLRDR